MILTINGCELEVERVSNLDIFTIDVSDSMPEPQVPKYYIEEQDRWEENPNHPTYAAALQIYYANRTYALFDELLKRYIKIVNPSQIFIPREVRRTYPDEPESFLFLKYVLFEDDETGDELINKVCLTETRVYHIFNTINILRNGMNIHQHDIKNIVKTNIEYEPLVLFGHQLVNPVDEYNACVESNISYLDWIGNKISLETMAKTIAIYRTNKIVELHSSDAVSVESERKSKAKT